MKEKKSSIKFKILVSPLISIFVSITIIAISCIMIVQNSLMDQMKTDGMNLTKQIKSQIEINSESMESINQSISDKIRTTGSFILNNSDKVNNEYLTSLAKQFEIDEINYTDINGKIIYSSLPTSIGSSFDSNHISYPVLKGDKDFFVENIRKSKETNDYYKYGYVSKSGIGMVQIGIIANKVQSLSKSIETQTLVEKLAEDESIEFAVFIDTNLAQIANSDVDEIGVKVDDIGSKTAAVEGKPYSSTYKYKGIEVYDVLVPVYDGDKLLGAIDLGLSMKTVKNTINNVLFMIIAISLVMFLMAAFILLKVSKGITNPLNKLVFAAGKIAEGDLGIVLKSIVMMKLEYYMKVLIL